MSRFEFDYDPRDNADDERPRACTCTRVPLHLADCPPEADCPIHGESGEESDDE